MSVKNYTTAQREVIDKRGCNLLVSASAGTGKTTVMIERICALIKDGLDASEAVVVTFTNLAAAEMKNRLAARLSQEKGDERIADQLEKLDTANICTLHSFCGNLLRNYFYVADIDPAFTILDSATVSTLRNNVLDELFADYFEADDQAFKRVYKIFSRNRRDDDFKRILLRVYDFSRCLEDFDRWYADKRNNLLQCDLSNPIVASLLDEIAQTVRDTASKMLALADRSADENAKLQAVCQLNAQRLQQIPLDSLPDAIYGVIKFKFETLPRKTGDASEYELSVRKDYETVKKGFAAMSGKYEDLLHGEDFETAWNETVSTVEYTDKLSEVISRFDAAFFEAKKQRGGIDFNDLEHLALKVLRDDKVLCDIRARYKMIFVDEYQDTNPVQEAIIARLAQADSLFMVGDVKQSIYGFRGCDPSIFVDKYNAYRSSGGGSVVELNDNFRSNGRILNFVNGVFNGLMTVDFGKVDYLNTAQLRGALPPVLPIPSVRIDFVRVEGATKQPAQGLYDICGELPPRSRGKQGALIAQRIKQYVGMEYRDGDGNLRRIGYGDIVILMRSLQGRAIDVYNALMEQNIPVAAAFKANGLAAKEVRDFVNLLRAIDNPFNDIYMVGACLSPFGGMTENELGYIRLDAQGDSFVQRLRDYAVQGGDVGIASKSAKLLALLQDVRFYAQNASVSDVAIYVLQNTDYGLYVRSLPNGELRIRKLYNFVDSLHGSAYAQTIDRFLSYIDESEDNRAAESIADTDAVRLMTMHASKGLEFPIVILAGVEEWFNFDPDAVAFNNELGIATGFYDFDAMRSNKTLGLAACELANRAKQREEELRLLYVAMTRAKLALNVVGVASEKKLQELPKLPSQAISHLDWLLYALRQQDVMDSVKAGIVECNTFDNVDSVGDSAEHAYVCPQTSDGAEAINFKYSFADRTDLPSKVVSSKLDKEYIDGEDAAAPVIYSDDGASQLGTAYHKVFQYVDFDADMRQIRETVEGLVNDGKIAADIAEQLDLSLVYATLNNPKLRKLTENGKTYHEISFMLHVPYNQIVRSDQTDKIILQGVIDLLIISGDSAHVVDFKYTSHSRGLDKRYARQLASYKLAVQRICRIDNVDAYVLSIADNKLIAM